MGSGWGAKGPWLAREGLRAWSGFKDSQRWIAGWETEAEIPPQHEGLEGTGRKASEAWLGHSQGGKPCSSGSGC